MSSSPNKKKMQFGFCNTGNSCFLSAAIHAIACVTEFKKPSNEQSLLQRTVMGLLEASRHMRLHGDRIYAISDLVPYAELPLVTCMKILHKHVTGDDEFSQGDASEAIGTILDLVCPDNKSIGHQVVHYQDMFDTGCVKRRLIAAYQNRIVRLPDDVIEDLDVLWKSLSIPRKLSMLSVVESKPNTFHACFNGAHVPTEALNAIQREFVTNEQNVFQLSRDSEEDDLQQEQDLDLSRAPRSEWTRQQYPSEAMIILRTQDATETSIIRLLEEYLSIQKVLFAPDDETGHTGLFNHVMLRRLRICIDRAVFFIVSRNKNASSKISQIVLPDKEIHVTGTVFSVVAVIYHLGSNCRNGHYVTAVRSPDPAYWIMCNDTESSLVPETDILTLHGHELFAAVYLRQKAS
jgi:hypothetical protein